MRARKLPWCASPSTCTSGLALRYMMKFRLDSAVSGSCDMCTMSKPQLCLTVPTQFRLPCLHDAGVCAGLVLSLRHVGGSSISAGTAVRGGACTAWSG
jgi:hypothetical protein